MPIGGDELPSEVMQMDEHMDEEDTVAQESIDVADPRVRAAIDRYWRSNVRIMLVLLVLWAFFGLGCGVLFADWLNQFRLGGFPLGFWFAQQGSILVFVFLILVYALLLNRLDKRHHRELDEIRREEKRFAEGAHE